MVGVGAAAPHSAKPHGSNPAAASCPKPRSRRHCHHLAASTRPGSIGTTWLHRIAQKPQCSSSKRCQSRQTVSIRSNITGFCRRHHTQSTKQHLTNPTQPEIPASHATNFSTTLDCNDSSACFQAGNAQPSPSPHTVHYEHATAACNPEPSRELLQKFPPQGTIALTPRRLRSTAI